MINIKAIYESIISEGKHWPEDYKKTAINMIKASPLGKTSWYTLNKDKNMNYTKTLITIGTILALGITAFVGCKDESGNKDKYLKFSEYAGTTAGYIVNASSVFVGPEVKDAITNVLTKMVTELPKEVTAETIDEDMRTIATNAVASLHVNEKYAEIVDKSVDTLLTVLRVGLTSIKEKHPTEFGNAEMFYTIAYTFFDNANSVIDATIARDTVEGLALDISPVTYEEIRALAKDDDKQILGKRDFKAFAEKLAK